MNTINLKSRLLVIVSGFLALMSLNSCLDNELSIVSEINQDFSNITSVEVDGAFLEVEYLGETGKQDVSLDALLKSNSNKRYEIVFDVVDGTKLKIEVKSGSGISGNLRAEGYIRLTGPKAMVLDLETGSGKVSAKDVVSTETKLLVGSGEIYAKNISSTLVTINSSSGNAYGEDIAGKVEALVSSGNLELLRIDGDVEAEGSSGQIKLSEINGIANVAISSGKIQLSKVKALGKATLSSGQLFATSTGLSAETSLKASSGNIYIQTMSDLNSFNFNISSGSGSVRVGDSQSSGNLVINNGSALTIRGEVNSGKIEIVN
ncbi:DUF4097 domain-containing protein [Aquiflexum gelatinilyticum]|uniref:DUF4097 domain-containing protein n=1 Tax=Aquiflexum gelatinilyticum TaxID=2961943 RepID=UPI0021673899|nr:DUF4097 domain-containing protein [Aquiflexum gelatinilyticum]MCS4434430.1 DUF4097 domain-containing protein [Aquiflexum gelatinilyticum]